nr:DNA polymerase [Candidatus Microthrix sp.]
MRATGLGQRLSIPTGEPQVIPDAYFEGFPNVQAYMEGAVADARERLHRDAVRRRRQIPELASRAAVRQAGERQAMNAGIQKRRPTSSSWPSCVLIASPRIAVARRV